jgi:mRNA-degrading endonuclease RelE of RelBE toxin-antitoxin system
MEEQFIELNSPEFETVVVILDASESAEKDWPTIVELAKRIFQKTPAEVKKILYFLSNPQEHDIEKFEDNVGIWRKQNNKKGSFITPILNQIKDAKIVIIGSGIIYDLDDWTTSEISKKIIFVKTSESMRGNLEIGTEIERDSFDGQLLNLHNRILSVKISGEEFLPYYWDNPGYSISFEGDIALKSSNIMNYSIKIATFGKNINAFVEKVEGNEKIALTFIDTNPPDIINIIENYGMKWEKLEKDEIEIFKKHIKSEKVQCPFPSCGKEITGPLKCDNQAHGRLLGRPIYNSLKNIKGFVILKDCVEGVYYKPYTSEIIKIDERKIALNKKSKAVIRRYEPSMKKWVEQEDLKPYFPLTGGYYVSIM